MPLFSPSNRTLIAVAIAALTVGAIAFAIAPYSASVLRALSSVRPRAEGPDLALWLAQPLRIQVHVYVALIALAIGTFVLLRPKGTGLHKILGWAWVSAMAVTAISSLFITDLNGGFFSFIHLFSGWTLAALPMGIYAIRRQNIRTHRATMTGIFYGGLIIAGALTFIPGRLMWTIFFG